MARGNDRLEAILLAVGAREPRYQITETHVTAMGLSIMTLAVLALLPFSWRFGRPWGMGLTIAPIALYVVYECLMSTRFLLINIRIDLLVIWPLLAAVIGNALYRWTRPSPKHEVFASPPVHGLAITSFTAGVLALFLNLLFVPSLVAIVSGHLVIYSLRKTVASKGKGLGFAGLVIGYIALLKELYMYLAYD